MRNIRYTKLRSNKIEFKDLTIDFGSRTYIMGILNVTPDSFSDGGEFIGLEEALAQVSKMIGDGADIIDVGGESTRPGFTPISIEEEISRVVPVIKAIKDYFDITISLDTSKAEVAKAGLEAGADLINDVWGLLKDNKLAEVIASYNVPVVLMHNQEDCNYSDDIIREIRKSLRRSIRIALKAGIKKESIILDPGIGFGKTQEQNREVLARLGELNTIGYPLLLGTSRKSIIGSILDIPPKERVEGTLATSTIGISLGADILRVHDVKENKRVALVTDKIVRI
ncbi:dihydropteroate synthase [Thiospirochaeta perfilievii]|uniref:Dihydropteroate synthase n=1 Tax=Thiospirochaeta perfilievii TaxID=252967 RepID=A0A5C1QCX9_9SPIO|nr:dihydropteroate synthase [Thiospirochaeta perfilievii]QEN04062.1 dihydropteroate synthase [Thiospirochaeta perfilievii]